MIFYLYLNRITSSHLKLAGEGNLLWLRCAFSSVNLASSASVLEKSFYFILTRLKSLVLKSSRQKILFLMIRSASNFIFSPNLTFRTVWAYSRAVQFPNKFITYHSEQQSSHSEASAAQPFRRRQEETSCMFSYIYIFSKHNWALDIPKEDVTWRAFFGVDIPPRKTKVFSKLAGQCAKQIP